MTRVLKLETKGFKSFANKTEIVYGEGFNVILGPNGSGKSNVLDALCFVLGKSGAKGLRAEKSANLIYNGGKSKTPAKQGEVSIYLDNSDNDFPLDTKIIKISRIIKQNGTSTYLINGEKHTREQILELLGNADIDPNGYNIILQGDIVRLVEMSPVERRGVIEEIAGIAVYEDKKRKAMNELDKIEHNLNEAEIILKEREGYLKEMKKERDQALQFKELTEKIKSLKATIVHVDIEQKNEEITKLNEKSAAFVEKIKGFEEEIKALKENVADYKKKIQDINTEIEEKGEKNQVALHKEVETLKVDIEKQKTSIEGYNNELERVKSQGDQLKKSLEDINTKISDFTNEIQTKEKALKDNTKLKVEIESKIETFKKKNKLDDATGIEDQIADLDTKAENLEKIIFEIRGKQQDFVREKDRLEMQIASADEKIAKVMEVSKANKSELERLKSMKDNFKSAVNDLQKCLTTDANLASQISTARGKVEKINQELAKVKVRQASMHEILGGNAAVKAIIEGKDKFNGVYGTVAELGSVDKKYAIALDVAAGNRLKSIVVKDDKVAAECIAFLKEQRLGTATFLPLNKIKGNTAKDIKGNGVIGPAISLIKFDPKFKAVFNYVFGSTIVVENIAVARRIGIGTAKMVTLDGDSAESSGAMKGGFNKKRPGSGFQETKDENEDALENTLADNQNMLATLQQQRQQNQDQIDRLRELKANLEGDIIRIEKSLHLDTDDLNISQKLKKEFEEKLKNVDIELQQINMTVSTKNRELAGFKIEKQKLRSQIMDMRNPTKLAELNTFQAKLDSLKSEQIKLTAELEQMKKQSQDSEINNIKELIASNDEEAKEIKEKITIVKEEIKEKTVVLKEKEDAEKEFLKEFKAYFQQRSTYTKNLEKEEEQIIKKQDQLKDVEHRNTAYSLDLARIKAELHALNEEFKQYEGAELLKPNPDMKKELWSAEQKIGRLGNVNMKALEIFERIEEEFNRLVDKKKILISEREKVLLMINEIESKKKDLFLKVFHVVNENFQKIFQILSTKGNASMVLENPKSPFDGGVEIKVKLKGTKYMDIRSLSGGEKTLTALAFIFAVQEHNPASFYIFDEVDAALDKRNSEKLASLIQSYSDKAQYIVISHNDGVINNADNLYGVSMDQHGVTKVVSLKI